MLSANKVDPEYLLVMIPELLLKGHEVLSMNILPGYCDPKKDNGLDWLPDSFKNFKDFKLANKTRSKI